MTLSDELRSFLPTVYDRYGPLNARQYAYRAEAAGLLRKTHSNWNLVNNILVELREGDGLPWSAVLDENREFLPLSTDAQPEVFLLHQQRWFRNSPDRYSVPIWRNQNTLPVIITEKAGLVPFFQLHTDELDTSVYAIKGQAGKSHLHESFVPWLLRQMSTFNVRLFYLGDYDDEGFQIEETLNDTLNRWGITGATPTVRLALTSELVASQRLRLDPINRKSKIAGKYVRGKAELEALDPGFLANLVRSNIEQLIDRDMLARTADEERIEQEQVRQKIRRLTQSWPEEDNE